ncbi:heavy-metal-associated domain-containing protein [Hymenobacter sp. BT175]|uniref:heavy-metal-associated domain-containing protein n=1 Tax=Hymenobacter translucens TaxID=2886507 RepID=UPI001D0E606E|nr:heavy metal-associated domain-containing protein [Hymenobacter translucens]MCC2548675.1 heavy-metal-associated domain-containing protein [Hymenobacter translucens]
MKLLFSLLLSLLALTSFRAHAQDKAKTSGTTQLQVKTSAVCEMCKARLEKAMAYEKGVQAASLDVPTQMLTITYRPGKTDAGKLRTAVRQTGYDADDQLAEARAYERLPDCCKKTNAIHTDSGH